MRVAATRRLFCGRRHRAEPPWEKRAFGNETPLDRLVFHFEQDSNDSCSPLSSLADSGDGVFLALLFREASLMLKFIAANVAASYNSPVILASAPASMA